MEPFNSANNCCTSSVWNLSTVQTIVVLVVYGTFQQCKQLLYQQCMEPFNQTIVVLVPFNSCCTSSVRNLSTVQTIVVLVVYGTFQQCKQLLYQQCKPFNSANNCCTSSVWNLSTLQTIVVLVVYGTFQQYKQLLYQQYVRNLSTVQTIVVLVVYGTFQQCKQLLSQQCMEPFTSMNNCCTSSVRNLSTLQTIVVLVGVWNLSTV